MAEATKPLSPEALDFAPSLLAIQESPPARLPRAVMYSVGALFVILLLWAIFGRLNIIASAEGRLVDEIVRIGQGTLSAVGDAHVETKKEVEGGAHG